MSGKILAIDEQVVIFVQLPKLAVDNVKVLVTEEVGDLVDVVLVLEKSEDGQEIGLSQLLRGDSAAPGSIDGEEDSGYHSVHVTRVEFRRLLQEAQTGMRIDDVLHEAHKVLGHEVRASMIALGQQEHELRGFVVVFGQHATQKRRKRVQRQRVCLVAARQREHQILPRLMKAAALKREIKG